MKKNTTILHSRTDDVVPFSDSVELVRNSGLSEEALIVTGTEHRLADDESLGRMLEACEAALDWNQGRIEENNDDGKEAQSLDG